MGRGSLHIYLGKWPNQSWWLVRRGTKMAVVSFVNDADILYADKTTVCLWTDECLVDLAGAIATFKNLMETLVRQFIRGSLFQKRMTDWKLLKLELPLVASAAVIIVWGGKHRAARFRQPDNDNKNSRYHYLMGTPGCRSSCQQQSLHLWK